MDYAPLDSRVVSLLVILSYETNYKLGHLRLTALTKYLFMQEKFHDGVLIVLNNHLYHQPTSR